MDLDYVKTKLQDANIETILLSSPIDIERYKEISVESNIDSYIHCLRTLNIQLTFLIKISFNESFFVCEIADKDEDEERYINLLDYEKGLEQFKCHIGKPYLSDFKSLYNDKTIQCLLYSDWYSDFFELRERALRQVEEQIKNEESIEHKKLEQVEVEKLDREKQLTSLFESLIDDKEFQRFILKGNATVKTMTLYALNKYPELNELDDKSIKSNISSIRDRVKVSIHL
jgi:hypothetical protein